jgi:protein gp37
VSEKTAIGWTDATWNPWYGCLKVSPGCKSCYMYRDMAKYGRDPLVVARSKTTFRDPLKWKDPRRVFTCSWSDFFIEQADAWRPEAWEIIRATPHLTYQILTKRPENILDRLPDNWRGGWPNVWLGVSAESQPYYDQRAAALLAIPAAVHFVSAEPLLGPIDLRNARGLDWLIVGGESGPGFRPMATRWVELIAEQCDNAGVRLFVKQDSGLQPGQRGILPPELWARKEFPR